MWFDGLFHTNVWEQYGFNDYQLKHCCFGSDGDSNEAGGEFADPGQGDFVGTEAEEDEGLATASDFSGLVGSGQMDEGDVRGAVEQAAGTSVFADPYADMIEEGIFSKKGDETTPSRAEIGFDPRFGYKTFRAYTNDPFRTYDVDDRTRNYNLIGGEQQRTLPNFINVPIDPSAFPGRQLNGNLQIVPSQQELGKAIGKSFGTAVEDSQDFGSALASLFGVKSPVAFDSEKGFYEGTEFDPFDAPLIGAALSFLSPPVGALYGLTKGIAKGDPIGGALNLIGPYSRLAPTIEAAKQLAAIGGVVTGRTPTLSEIVGLDTRPSENFVFGTPENVINVPERDFLGYLGDKTGFTSASQNVRDAVGRAVDKAVDFGGEVGSSIFPSEEKEKENYPYGYLYGPQLPSSPINSRR